MPQGMVAPHTTPFGACLGVPPNGFTAHHMPPTPCMGYPTMPWSAPVSSPLTAQTAQQPIQGPPATSGTGSWSKPASVQGPQTKQSAPETPEDEDLDDSSSAQTSEIRSMLRQRMKKEGDGYQRPKSSLGSVRIEEYWGERSRYVKWKRTIQAQQCLYGLESQELAMLIYLSTRREARDVVEQHPVTSYTGAGGLHLLWRVLDEAFGESEAELFERADKELEESMKERAAQGKATMKIPAISGEPLLIGFFDASLGTSKSTHAQQGEIHLLTSTTAFRQPTPMCVLEFHSNRIKRVVRSSLAAEGCAVSSCGDRQLFSRVLLDAFLYGKTEVTSQWRRELKTSGCLVTDAKGLHDHLHKTGGVATERQAALDMLLMKQLIEDGIIGLKWTPTWRQLADPLTKEMMATLLEDLKKSGQVCLTQTAADAKEEERRAGIRRGQRERRKERMKNTKEKTRADSNTFSFDVKGMWNACCRKLCSSPPFTFSLPQGIRMTAFATGKGASLPAFCFCWADLVFPFSVAERLLFLVGLVLSGTGPPNHPQIVHCSFHRLFCLLVPQRKRSTQ